MRGHRETDNVGMAALCVCFIYERLFETDADGFTLRSLDVATADHIC